ncbi:hypothetical protein TRFO_06604 [Tritrichomonas foetus]|uniref:Uncharacterized protein n=1 Tax=Tritrichomonas foetus TaxID=1144522 RepID=A0A1J4K2N8_9EUKA|nr:hypothetical protein TRFO_06604 [Tritrichomonas foetus]|eukprot:OHT03757.1 hypothetical protein TRFO_06604 [Tritrichomonas foetus]
MSDYADTRNFIESANLKYEEAFQSAALLARDMDFKDDCAIAAKRTLSYNPANQKMMDMFPQYKEAYEFIQKGVLENSKILASKKEMLCKKDFFKTCFTISCLYLGMGDFPNTFGTLLFAARIKTKNNYENIIENNQHYIQLNKTINNLRKTIYGDNENNHIHVFEPQHTNCDLILSLNDEIYYNYFSGVILAHFKYHDQANECFQHIEEKYNANCHNAVFCEFFNTDFLSDLYFRYGISLRNEKKYDKSIDCFRKILENPPNSLLLEDIKFQLAFTYQCSHNYEDAETVYHDIFENNRENIHIILQYAWFLFISKRNINLAIKILQDSLDSFSDVSKLLFLLGKIMLSKNDTKSAYTYYKKCISYWSDEPSLWYNFGILYYINQQMQDSVVAFQRALYLSCDLVEAWLNLGTILEDLEEKEDAKKIYITGIKNCGRNELLTQRIKRINRKEKQKDHEKENDKIFKNIENDKYDNVSGNLANKQSDNSNEKNYKMIDFPDDKYFVQIPASFANSYIMAVPRIPLCCLGVPGSKVKWDVLSTLPKSLFKNVQ